jgi:hypothetical protein
MSRRVAVAAAIVAVAGLAAGLAAVGCGDNARPNPDPPPEAPDPDLSGPDFFADVTKSAGIDFAYRNGEEVPHLAILESLGGGLAAFDYDGDGLLDLFLVGGGHYGGADKKQILGHPCRLYRNEGNWKFKDVTAAVGLDKPAGGAWFY